MMVAFESRDLALAESGVGQSQIINQLSQV